MEMHKRSGPREHVTCVDTMRRLALLVIALKRAMSRDPGRRNQALPWRCVLELARVWALGGFEYQPAFALLDC